MLRDALRYARELCWLVFPVWEPNDDGSCSCGKSDCSSPGKHPRTWRGVKCATNEESQIKRWWSLWPNANIGLSTNSALVLDIDGKQGEKDLARLERKHGALPRTVEAETSKGRHIFFRVCNYMPSSTHVLRSLQIDSRGRGGYVLLAPSQHASGFVYDWRRSPFDYKVAVAPRWLEKRLLRDTRTVKIGPITIRPKAHGVHQDESRSGRDARRMLRAFLAGKSKAQARKLLLITSTKAREEGDHYVEMTLGWAYATARAYAKIPDWLKK